MNPLELSKEPGPTLKPESFWVRETCSNLDWLVALCYYVAHTAISTSMLSKSDKMTQSGDLGCMELLNASKAVGSEFIRSWMLWPPEIVHYMRLNNTKLYICLIGSFEFKPLAHSKHTMTLLFPQDFAYSSCEQWVHAKFVWRLEHSKLDVSLKIPPQTTPSAQRLCACPTQGTWRPCQTTAGIRHWFLSNQEVWSCCTQRQPACICGYLYQDPIRAHAPSIENWFLEEKHEGSWNQKVHMFTSPNGSWTTVPSTNTHKVWVHCASLYTSPSSSLYVLSSEALESLARARLPSPQYWSRPWFLAPRLYSDTGWHQGLQLLFWIPANLQKV